jgi:hypothetical protein
MSSLAIHGDDTKHLFAGIPWDNAESKVPKIT